MKKSTKDNLIGISLSAFTGIIGAAVPFGFEVKNMAAGLAGAIVGTAAGAAFKELRRGKTEKRPKKFFIPYIAGAIISSAIAIAIWATV